MKYKIAPKIAMKKLLSTMLFISMIANLAACSNSNKPDVTGQDGTLTMEKLAGSSEIKSETPKDNEETKLPKDEETELPKDEETDKIIIDNLKKFGYDTSKGYSEKVYGDYIYPEYIQINDKLKTIYLSLSGMKDFDREAGYIDQSMKTANMINSSPTSNLSSNKSYGIKDAISGALNSIAGGNTGIRDVQSFIETDSLPAGEFYDLEDGLIINSEPFNTSEYESVDESNFLSTKTNPLSTFSSDVDTASYTNLRAILRENISGIIPTDDRDAQWIEAYCSRALENIHDVRIEEMLNYFKFSSSSDVTKTDEPFVVKTEIATTPWNNQTKLLEVNVKAKELDEAEKIGSNLVFLIDTSGSMNDASKLYLVKQSINMLIDNLSEKDTISIVTYSGDSALLIEGANAKNDAEKLHDIINKLEPYGSTNGSGGIETAYRVAAKYKEGHSNSRIIMCSDGDLNVGITSKDGLERLVESNRDKGIYLTILGFGLGNYKDSKMEVLADKGNGNYYYIDNLKEGYKVLVENITSTLITLADDVKFQIEFNPEFVKAYRKIGYENRNLSDTDFTDDTKDAGEIGYGHEVTIVYEIVTNDSDMKLPEKELKYQQTVATNNSSDWATISIRYKDHGEKESKLVEYTVNEENYSAKPTENWEFISDVVGFGLIVNNSKYIEGLTIDKLLESLDNLELTDNDMIEFISIVELYDEYLQKMQVK